MSTIAFTDIYRKKYVSVHLFGLHILYFIVEAICRTIRNVANELFFG
jgi:hypothetical protein